MIEREREIERERYRQIDRERTREKEREIYRERERVRGNEGGREIRHQGTWRRSAKREVKLVEWMLG